MHEIVIIIAKYFIVIAFLISLYVWLKLATPAKKQFILQAVVGGILALILAKFASKLFYNPRPFQVGNFTPYFYHAPGNGFPSDHTLLTSFLAVLVAQYSRKYGIALFLVAAAVGLARVVAGVHHLADIIGAMIIAAIGLYAALWLIQQYRKFTDHRGHLESSL